MNVTPPSLQTRLEPLRRAWQGSRGPHLLAWWLGELRALLPPHWLARLDSGAVWHRLRREAQGWSMQRDDGAEPAQLWSDTLPRGAQQERLLAAYAATEPEDRRLVLCLPAHEALRRRLTLPAAARTDLRRVVAYELDRQTPFRTDQVYYAVRETPKPAGEGRITVELAAVPRERLEQVLSQLAELDIAVDAVDIEAASERLGFDLLPPERVPQRRHPRRRLNLLLAGGGALLILLCMNQWLSNRRQALAAMRTEVASISQQAQKVAVLRRQWKESAAAAGFLAQRKRQQSAVLAVLEELTERLPDDTWLERFSIDNNGQLGFMGQSPQAAHMVDILKGARLFGEPSFQGTIMRDPVTHKERFYMRAQLHQPTVASASSAARGRL